MPRPCKRRRVCAVPGVERFAPAGSAGEPVRMTLDEYETVRLIDFDGLTQEECARQMGVARTTAQAIYNSARQKLARCLVEARELRIEGGEYELCDGQNHMCHRRNCCGGHCRKKEEMNHENCSDI